MAGSSFISLLKPKAVDSSAGNADAQVFNFSKEKAPASVDTYKAKSNPDKSLSNLEGGRGVAMTADVMQPSRSKFFRS